MKVCIITFRYKPSGGGIERYVDTLSRSLIKLGHKVDIITVSYDGEKIERKDNLTVYRTPFLNTFNKSKKQAEESGKKFLGFLKNYLDENNVDIIEVENMHAIVLLAAHTLAINMMCMERKIPLILTIHSFPIKPYDQFTISFAKDLMWDKINTVSSSVAETYYNEGVEIEKIQIIHPGINTDEFMPGLGRKWLRSRVEGLKEKDIVILHASRINNMRVVEEKGIRTLLKAFSILSDQYKDIKLLIASAPPASPVKEEYEKTVEEVNNISKLFKIKDKVKIVSFDLEEMPKVYNGADIFVMASQTETFGLVYAEAMACGLPVIGTDVGGIPEIIENGSSGYLVSADNAVELSKYLSVLILDTRTRKKFGRNGRKIILKKFDANKLVLKKLGLYNSLIYHKEKFNFFKKFF